MSACLVCRGRKTKCDNQRPQCGFCKQTGAECVYEAEKLATYVFVFFASLTPLFSFGEERRLIMGDDETVDSTPPHWRFWINSPR